MSRNKPDDVRAYEPTPQDRPVDDPKLRGRSVDGITHVPMPGEKPVDGPVYELVIIERPADVVMYEPAPRERPVEDTKLRGRPVDDVVYDSAPRDRPVDDQKLRGRPGDDQTYEPKPKGRPVDLNTVPLWCEPPPPADLPEWSESEVMPLIIIDNSSVVNKPNTTDGLLPIGSDILLPQSPEVTSFDDQGSMSAPLSPNRVRKGHSQDMPAEGSLFEVSPDVPGFHMRPAGGGVQMAEITQPSPSKFAGFNNPFFGAPIAFAQCQNTSGMDTTTTVPIYNMPKDSNIGIDQSAVPTVFASGVSPDSIPWSTAEDIIRDIVREGPFDAGATPMETEDKPFHKYEHARLPVQNDFLRRNSYGRCRYKVWSTAPPPPVSGVHRSSGVGKIVESLTSLLGGQIGSGKCYGGSRKPTEGCRIHDVEAPDSGTIRNVVTSDVSGNVDHWCGSRGLSGG